MRPFIIKKYNGWIYRAHRENNIESDYKYLRYKCKNAKYVK